LTSGVCVTIIRGPFLGKASAVPIPQSVRATAAITQRQAYRGELPVRSLERLRSLLADDSTVLQVELQAERERGKDRLHGQLQGPLRLNCQRCQRVFDWTLQTRMDLRLVHSEAEEQAVLQEADPYCVQDDTLPVRELIEDEVLLTLPMLPRCQSCENEILKVSAAEVAEPRVEAAEPERKNPFAALQDQLKSKR